MTTVNKKRLRISSPGSDSDDTDQGNPKTHENGQNGDDFREKRIKSNTCYVCDGKDNWVLVCHGEECLISIHQSCTSDEPDFDEFGNFYCPYCWYKRVVVKSLKLKEKLLGIEKSRKGRETLGGVDLGLVLDKVSEDVENVEELNVAEGRRVTVVNPSGNRRECDESYEKFMATEKDQRMKEVAAETQSQEVSEAGDDDDMVEKPGRNEEASDACNSTAEVVRMRRARGNEKSHEKVQVCNSDIGKERKKQRRCDISHETAQMHSFVAGVNTRKQRRYSEKNQQNERLARTHEKNVFINDEGAGSDLGEGTSGQGCCHENNQQQKASSAESCEQEVRRADKRVSHSSELGEGMYQQGRDISENGQRKWKRAVVRDGYEFDLPSDMRNDGATISEQENGFGKDEQIEHNSASSISSPISTDNVNDSNAASQELALIIHPGVQEQPIEAEPVRSAPPYKSSCNIGQKSYLEKNRTAFDDCGQRRFVLCSDRKRKRLYWTQAEEEMLRVGVQKFPGFRNIPWRKILEFGQDVFHEERVPSDLKDKWKNMNKMSFEVGKWVSLSTERQQNLPVSEACSERNSFQ